MRTLTREDKLKYLKTYRETHRRERYLYNREYFHKLKLTVLTHYSGTNPPQCANPYGEHKEPYTNIKALSIDHINGGGNKHRKTIGWSLYYWLIAHNYPKGFQVLCMNCQFIKKYEEAYTESLNRIERKGMI
jgi:hypothetical protein